MLFLYLKYKDNNKMFKNKSKPSEDNYNFDSQLTSMKRDLFFIKRARNQNTVEGYYHSFPEVKIPEKTSFKMNSNYQRAQNSFQNELKKIKKNRQHKPAILRSRLQNYEIEDSFCLKFKVEKHHKDIMNNDEDIDFIYEEDEIQNTNDNENIFLNEDKEKIKLYTENYNHINVTEIEEEEIEVVININMNVLIRHIKNGNKIIHQNYNLTKNKPHSEIPLHCYTTWHTKELPDLMKNNYDFLKQHNPELNFHFYDDESCLQFIKNHFDKKIAHAYEKLVPASYKSDLWRYCVLYVNGGAYLDIKYCTTNDFKLIELFHKEQFVYDHYKNGTIWGENNMGLYTSLIIVKPQNEILYQCIDKIVNNVEKNYYGKNALYPTGPGLLGQTYFKVNSSQNTTNYIENIELYHHEESNAILYKNTTVLDVYKEYRDEQLANQNNLHYSHLWNQKSIYHKTFNVIKKQKLENKDNYLPNVVCIIHIGSYNIFLKITKYIDNLIYAQYDEYNLTIYFNIIDTIQNEHINNIKDKYPDANYVVSENYGFDIGSFFHILQVMKENNESYDYIVKIHTKTNNERREQLLVPILGSIQQIRNIIEEFQRNPRTGIIGSRSCRCIDAHSDFVRNKHYLQELMKWYFNETTHVIKQAYVTGSMFWMRFIVVQKIFMPIYIPNIYNSFNNIYSFDWSWYYYANKLDHLPYSKNKIIDHYNNEGKKNKLSTNMFHAVKYNTKTMVLRDGMIEHAYERFFCYAVHRLGLKTQFFN